MLVWCGLCIPRDNFENGENSESGENSMGCWGEDCVSLPTENRENCMGCWCVIYTSLVKIVKNAKLVKIGKMVNSQQPSHKPNQFSLFSLRWFGLGCVSPSKIVQIVKIVKVVEIAWAAGCGLCIPTY